MENIFERRCGMDTISDRSFYIILGLMTLYGLAATAIAGMLTAAAGITLGWPSIIGIIVVTFIGVLINGASQNPIVSFLGYNLVAIPFGILLGVSLPAANIPVETIQSVALTTGGVTCFMMFLGTVKPNVFLRMGSTLFWALIGLIVLRVAGMFVPAIAAMGWIDWLAAGIFSLYIAFDWARAGFMPKTVDNAVDVALALYLDIINLFLSLLNIASDD